MYLFDDVKSSSSDITKYLWARLDSYARSEGKKDRNEFSEEEWRLSIGKLCTKLYDDLSIIDSKASGLVSSNSITTAIFSLIAFSSMNTDSFIKNGSFIQIFSFILLGISFLSLILNVSSLYVYWSTTTEISEWTDIDDRARSLIRIRNDRTKRYRIAFITHMAVLFSALFAIILILLMMLAKSSA